MKKSFKKWTWKELFHWIKTREKPIEEKEKPPEMETFWRLDILYKNNTKGGLESNIPDSEEFEGINLFLKVAEWFMGSNNPYFKIGHGKGFMIFVRSEITEINVTSFKKEKK